MTKTPREKVEQWLRHWGAEEAVRQTRPAPLRPASAAPAGRPAPRRDSFWSRYWPIAAGIILCAAAATMSVPVVSTTHTPEPPAPLVITVTQPAASDDQLQADLKAERQKISDLNTKQQELETQLTDARSALAGKFKEADALNQKITDLQNEKTTQLKALDNQIALLKKNLLDSQTADAGLQRRLDDALAERTRVEQNLNTKLTAALADAKDAQTHAQAVSIKENALLSQLRDAYFADAAPGAPPIVAGQAAMQKNKLLERYTRLRPAIQDPGARAVCDRLEMLLTQLNLLDPNDPAKISSYSQLLTTVQPAKQIDLALTSPNLDPALKRWLVETELILTGM